MAQRGPGGVSLLLLPPNALLAIFAQLSDSLADAVALGMTCKGLHELGIGARTRHLACAACRHRLCNPAVACRGGLPQPALMLQDGHTLCAAVEHVPSCRLSPEFPLEEWHLRWSLASCAGIRQAFEDPNFDVKAQHVYCDGCGLYVGARLTQLGGLRADAAAVCR